MIEPQAINRISMELARRKGPCAVAAVDIDFLLRYCIALPADVIDQAMAAIHEFFLCEFADGLVIRAKGDDGFYILCDGCGNSQMELRVTQALLKFRKRRFFAFLGAQYAYSRLTFSAGIASVPENGTGNVVGKKAFSALLLAKALRRNQIACYEEPSETVQDRSPRPDNGLVENVVGQWGKAGCVRRRTKVAEALLWEPQAIACDDECFYIADQNNHQILACDFQSIWPIYGDGQYGGPKERRLNKPTGLHVHGGFLYIADTGNDMVVALHIATGKHEIICGTGWAGSGGDGGPATQACVNKPGGVVVDRENNVYINDIANNKIRKIDRNGIISTFAGTGRFEYGGDGEGAGCASFNEIYGVCIDPQRENIYVADYMNRRIRKIDVHTGLVTTAVGGGEAREGDGKEPRTIMLSRPVAVCAYDDDMLCIAESGANRLRLAWIREGAVKTLMGKHDTEIGMASNMGGFRLSNPNSLCRFQDSLLVLDGANNRIIKIHMKGIK